MHPTLRRLPPVLALVVPLVLAGTTATGLPAIGVPADSEGASDPHAEMSETEHAESTEPAEEHEDMPADEHAESTEPADKHEDMPADEHEDMPADEHAESETEQHEEVAPQARPRAAVISTFAGVNGAVLGAAAFLRRRDRLTPRHRPRAGSASPTPNA